MQDREKDAKMQAFRNNNISMNNNLQSKLHNLNFIQSSVST